jgi:hypothetical protein
VPTSFAVILPLTTVATAESLLVQLTVLLSAFSGKTVTKRVSVSPILSVNSTLFNNTSVTLVLLHEIILIAKINKNIVIAIKWFFIIFTFNLVHSVEIMVIGSGAKYKKICIKYHNLFFNDSLMLNTLYLRLVSAERH